MPLNEQMERNLKVDIALVCNVLLAFGALYKLGKPEYTSCHFLMVYDIILRSSLEKLQSLRYSGKHR